MKTPDLAPVLAAMEANRDRTDPELEIIVQFFLTREQLADIAVAALIRDFRKQAPAPKQRPSLLFV